VSVGFERRRSLENLRGYIGAIKVMQETEVYSNGKIGKVSNFAKQKKNNSGITM